MPIMKDSKLDDAWLKAMIANNPPSVRENGNLVTGPVRLAFAALDKPGKPGQDGGEGKFGAALLFPPGVSLKIFSEAWLAVCRQYFPNNFDQAGNPVGLHMPFHEQREKAFGAKPLAGYTEGGYHFTASSKFKPTIVDFNMNPVVDPSKLYSGVWAIVACNVYHYGLSPPRPKKGASFGMQTVMIIADDMRLVGGGGDPKSDFAQIRITAQSNIAAKMDGLPGAQQPTGTSLVLPGMAGAPHQGNLPIHDLNSGGLSAEELEELAALQ